MAKFLPTGVCDRPAAPLWGSTRFTALLRETGILVGDGPALVRAMKARDPLPPFARGRTHWTLLVGKRFASIMMDELGRSSRVDWGGLTLRDPEWTASPIGSDADLATLLNLWRPPLDYPTGTAELVCRSTEAGRQAALIAGGGSFAVTVIEHLAACGLFDHLELYFYYMASRLRWPGDRERVDRAGLRWQDLLDGPHVVLVEQNESLLGGVRPISTSFSTMRSRRCDRVTPCPGEQPHRPGLLGPPTCAWRSVSRRQPHVRRGAARLREQW